MARSQSNNALTMTALAIVVAGVSTGVGYYLANGTHSSGSSSGDHSGAQPTTLPVAPGKHHATDLRLTASRHQNANYTAPGSPSIEITEERTPVLREATHLKPDLTVTSDTSRPKSHDTEASQEAPPQPASDSSSDPSKPAPPSIDVTESSTNSPSDTATTSGSTSDPDYEKIGGHTDPEANQEGSPDAKAEYRVQIGAFGEAKNARILAEALRNRGINATLREEHQGDKTVYKVQTGSYRSKAAASKAALDQQRSGFPASVTQITP